MSIDLVMPKLGLTMTEGTIQEWIQKPGEPFKKGAVLLVVETEKIANEIEATADGVLESILVQAGDTALCGQPIAKWSSKGDVLGDQVPARASEQARMSARASSVPSDADRRSGVSATHEIPPPAAHPGATLEQHPPPITASGSSRPEIRPPPFANDRRIVSTPYARKLARRHGIDLSTVAGSGPRGRIKGPDVERALQSSPGGQAQPSFVSTSLPPPRSQALQSGSGLSGKATVRRPATHFEKVTAERLTAAKQVPHFYLASEAEIGALEALRTQLNALEGKPKVSVTHLVLAALARTLHDHPRANEVYDAGELVRFGSIDIAVAISTERGLLAPVVRDLGNARIFEIAEKTRELVERARTGKLRQDDFGGGATSLSNAGMHDVTYMTSIITPGHSSIFGIGSVRQVFRPGPKGEPLLRRELGIVMSCDHRVHDGVGGLAILNRFKFYLENPLQIVI